MMRFIPLILFPLVLSWPLPAGDILPAEILPGVPPEGMMKEWLRGKAHAALEKRKAAFEKLGTEEDLSAWQEERKAFFLGQLGGFPERTPLHAKVTGELEFEDYRIEKLHFESQPGFHVTANLYLPKGRGPFPAVLHPTGHSANAKNRDVYQMASITIARAGCAVLCYDPVGQGERDQVFGEDGKPYSSTLQHSLINQGAHLLGSNTARLMIWDGMRAIDYLQSRSDILADRIGCTGISGGGTNTSYLMALDERILAAAPGCYLTGFGSLFDTIGPQDAEQNIHGQVAFGLDHSDYVLMRLPRPTLIMAATRDYFDIRGAWELFREGKRFAARLGFPERIDLVEPDTEHGFPPGMRVGAANWMRRWLLDRDDPVRPEKEPVAVPEEQLNVISSGQVMELDGSRTAFDLHREWSEEFAGMRVANAKPENREKLLETVRRLIHARHLKELAGPQLSKVDGGMIIESEPGIFLPARLSGEGEGPPVLFLPGKGEVEPPAESGKRFLSVDLRGLGETSVRSGKGSSWTREFGANWKDTFAASLLNRSFVGMRAEDIWQVVRAWRKETGNADLRMDVIATGEAAIPALHAAVLEPDLFGNITVSDALSTWEDVVVAPAGLKQQANLVFGALREYDLPVLREILGEKLMEKK